MPGKGKYTAYQVPASSKKSLLERLYTGSPFAGMDQTACANPANINSVVSTGNNVLRGRDFAGSGDNPHAAKDGIVDTGVAGDGKVDLTFAGRTSTIQPPDTHEGKDVGWKNPGDPANPYMPDISSPGPGRKEGVDKDRDPNIKTTDLENTKNFDPVKASINTMSPSTVGSKVYTANSLGDGTVATTEKEQFGA